MEENLEKLLEIKEKEIIKAFSHNNITAMFVNDQNELINYLKNILVDQKVVSVGGSVTLNQLGVIDLIRNSDVQFLDRYKPGLTTKQLEQCFRDGFSADLFFTSTNALTIDGCLYNVDGNGNRVAQMIYGPSQVIVIAGINKIFHNEQEAIDHISNVAAPANAIRLNNKTPCTKTGHCMNCLSEDRICCSYVKLGYQRVPGRIKVIIVKENLGY